MSGVGVWSDPKPATAETQDIADKVFSALVITAWHACMVKITKLCTVYKYKVYVLAILLQRYLKLVRARGKTCLHMNVE